MIVLYPVYLGLIAMLGRSNDWVICPVWKGELDRVVIACPGNLPTHVPLWQIWIDESALCAGWSDTTAPASCGGTWYRWISRERWAARGDYGIIEFNTSEVHLGGFCYAGSGYSYKANQTIYVPGMPGSLPIQVRETVVRSDYPLEYFDTMVGVGEGIIMTTPAGLANALISPENMNTVMFAGYMVTLTTMSLPELCTSQIMSSARLQAWFIRDGSFCTKMAAVATMYNITTCTCDGSWETYKRTYPFVSGIYDSVTGLKIEYARLAMSPSSGYCLGNQTYMLGKLREASIDEGVRSGSLATNWTSDLNVLVSMVPSTGVARNSGAVNERYHRTRSQWGLVTAVKTEVTNVLRASASRFTCRDLMKFGGGPYADQDSMEMATTAAQATISSKSDVRNIIDALTCYSPTTGTTMTFPGISAPVTSTGTTMAPSTVGTTKMATATTTTTTTTTATSTVTAGPKVAVAECNCTLQVSKMISDAQAALEPKVIYATLGNSTSTIIDFGMAAKVMSWVTAVLSGLNLVLTICALVCCRNNLRYHQLVMVAGGFTALCGAVVGIVITSFNG